jgi:hypothetical protein
VEVRVIHAVIKHQGFILCIFAYPILYVFFNYLGQLKIENLVYPHYGQNGMKPMLMLNHGILEVEKRKMQEQEKLVQMQNQLVQ